jgi:hypothetical protein
MVYFHTKNPTFYVTYMEGLGVGNCCIFYGHWYICVYLVYYVIIWNILLYFGIFSPVLVSCTKKILATLVHTCIIE